MLDEMTVVFPTFHCPEYARIVIQSFEHNRPHDMRITYVVVENSDDDTYASTTKSLGPVVWVQNPIDTSRWPSNAMHSFANAAGVERGLQEVKTEWVFIAHSDVCVSDPAFFMGLRKRAEEGNVLIGTVKDNIRAKAIHVSGYLTRTELAKRVGFYPRVDPPWVGTNQPVSVVLDVGDELDLLCQHEGLKTFCYPNTENGLKLKDGSQFEAFPVDRCVDEEGRVIFMHLGRGADKMAGRYTKHGRILRDGWVSFCQQFM